MLSYLNLLGIQNRWINYLFTIVWVGDAIRLCSTRAQKRSTDSRIDVVIQSFFAFIVFNATVVFGPPVYRFLAVPVGLLLFWSWKKRQSAGGNRPNLD